ncbi:MAG: hypothetical protein OXK80_02715 [Bdellovibrionales bacterium]|nr:hypothetical protein [Bdellovibrionales bacterium]
MKTFFSFLVFLSIFNCAGPDFTPNFSNDQFVEQIQGVYESNYKNTVFEIWIEKANLPESDIRHRSGLIQEALFVMVFEKNKRTEIEMLLRKYQDTDMLAQDICSYVENLSWGTHGLWRVKNMGGLAGLSVPADATQSPTIPLETLFYIDFPTNDEHGFTSLEINNSGEAVKISFFETGFIKKPWNYFLTSSMPIRKQSNNTLNLLSRFYINSDRANQEIPPSTNQSDRQSYCNKY